MPSGLTAPFLHKTEDAYTETVGRYSPQSWFSFDTTVEQARKNGASKFAMTVWNHREGVEKGRAGFVEDIDTGAWWYRLPRKWEDKDPKKRVALFNAIDLALEQEIPMKALLKDHKTGAISLDHTFDIAEVAYEVDGSTAWLRLQSNLSTPGTVMVSEPLARLATLPRRDPILHGSAANATPAASPGKSVVTTAQIELACSVAREIFAGRLSFSDGVEQLMAAGYHQATGGVALRNYAHIRKGENFSSLMSIEAIRYFVGSILADDGPDALGMVLKALKAHANGVKAGKPPALMAFIEELEGEERMLPDLRAAAELAKQDQLQSLKSEVQRLVWERGPHHQAFRDMLRVRWGGRCSVHGPDCDSLLIASHIVPRSRSTDAARCDPNNGLLLSVPLDALFDAGLISFDEDGRMLSDKVAPNMRSHYGLAPNLRLRWEHLREIDRDRIRTNLAAHRDMHGI